MNALSKSIFFSLALLFFASIIQADDTDDIDKVCSWTQQTLIDTFSVNYTQTENDFAQVRTHYTLNAWGAISEFLSSYMDIIHKQQLTIHPVILVEPNVVNSGIASGIQYLRVNQTISLPEINTVLELSVVVLKTSVNSKSPYIIQSVNFVKHAN